jgi:hypothetical protein
LLSVLKSVCLLAIVSAALVAGPASARVTVDCLPEEQAAGMCTMTPEPVPAAGAAAPAAPSGSTASAQAAATAKATVSTVRLSAKLKAADLTAAKAKASATLKLSATLGHALKRTVTIKGTTKCYVGAAGASCAKLYAKLKAAASLTVETPKPATKTIVATAIRLAA